MIDSRWRDARRVLLVRLDNLGDVLVTTPAFHAVREALPGAHLTLLASPVGAQVGRLNPDLDEVVVYEAPWMDPWHKLPQDSARELAMVETIRAGHYDGAIIFTSYHQSPLPAAYLCYLADIPLRVAASIDGPGSLLTTRHKHPERAMHEVERGLDLVGALGMTTEARDLVLRVPPVARKRMAGDRRVNPRLGTYGREARLRGLEAETTGNGDPLVVVHPGCSTPARTYPWEQFAEVVELLVAELGARVALTGAADEAELIERIMARLSARTRRAVMPLAGELEFDELCALIEAADVTITNNTGPMHIAAALKTPVVALFALTNPPEQWGPWQVRHCQLFHEVPCRLCYARVCPYGHECLAGVTPREVIAATRELLTDADRNGAAGQVRRDICGHDEGARHTPLLMKAAPQRSPARTGGLRGGTPLGTSSPAGPLPLRRACARGVAR